MRLCLLQHFVLVLACLGSVAVAKPRDVVERIIQYSENPTETAEQIYVAGRVVTVLRFEHNVDPARTRMLSWEGWFEPLVVGGKKVVLEPLRNIEPWDRFMLKVRLVDGTEFPFIVTSREQSFDGWRDADQQISVFRDLGSAQAVQASLHESRRRERELREKIERHEQEDSVDHALAALLVKGATQQTPFREHEKWVLREGDVEFVVRVFAGKEKAAVLFTIRNQSEEQEWRMNMARLSTAHGGKDRPCAVRADREAIGKGTIGHVAVVADKSAFVEANGVEQLLLELYRGDGLRQVVVVLDPKLIRE